MLTPQFERAGLPEDHGISLEVSKDGQLWWAWRRTITGWHLGIGAIAPPPDEWFYEHPEPPAKPPGEYEQWSQWGADSKNW